MGVVFPLISMLIMYRSKTISSLSIPIRKERLPILSLVLIYYSMIYYVFWNWNNQWANSLELYLSFLFGGIITLFLATLITLKWKISLHSIAISGFSGGMLGALLETIGDWAYVYNIEEMMIYNTILLLLIGLVAYSRLILNSHTPKQVLAGTALGFTIELTCVLQHIHI
jgi:membrane-associated phospholipid phosphatase